MATTTNNPEDPQLQNLSFDNTEIAFREKNDAELKKAYWLFKVMGSKFLTRVGPPITNFALNLGLPIEGLIKNTIFSQFCGGESIAECEPAIEKLAHGKVGTILDYSVEGEEEEKIFNQTADEIVRTIKRAAGDVRIPITVFKVTGIGRFGLLAKVNIGAQLSMAEQAEFIKVKSRVDMICRAAHHIDVPVMIDAEESWVQNTIDKLALEAMRNYNRERAIVYNTYQLYRHDKLASLKADISFSADYGFTLGAKLVRGAYMEKERKRAEEQNYTSPIQPDKAATDRDYNAALRLCAQNIDHVAVVVGTHNEESCQLMVDLMHELRISPENRNVFFSQLLGMSDNLSFNLANAGYHVAKYVPYGPIKTVMPYLFRRAQENTSVQGQTGRELSLIIKEKKRRKRQR